MVSMRIWSVVLVVCLVAGCRTTTGTVLGGVTLVSSVAGNALVISADHDDRELATRTSIGYGLIVVATLAILGVVVVESRAGSEASAGSGGGGGDHGHDGAAFPHAPGAAPHGEARGNTYYDRTGAVDGRLDATGTFYDRTGAIDARVDGTGTYYDQAGATAGRVDATNTYYDRTGATAGRLDAQGTIYDKTGASAGRIDASGAIYDQTGTLAGRVDGACDDACRRAAAARILLAP